MDDFYQDVADFVGEILAPTDEGGLGQGEVKLRRSRQGDPIDPTNPWLGHHELLTFWKLNAAGGILHQRYEKGVLIVETGMMLTIAPTMTLIMLDNVEVAPEIVPFAPENSDILVVNGFERGITNITPITAHGQPPAWKVWSKS